MAYRLITPFFNSPHPSRASELEWCLLRNSESFDWVLALGEPATILPKGYDRGREFAESQTFGRALDAAQHDQTNDVTVIANADIYVPRATLELIDDNIRPGQVYCLSRWDFSAQRGVSHFNVDDSQDAWVFRGAPVCPGLSTRYGFQFGVPGCDNRMAAELHRAGYEVLNPSCDVRTYHVHFVAVRPLNEPHRRVPLPYLCVRPHALGEKPVYREPLVLPTQASYHWT